MAAERRVDRTDGGGVIGSDPGSADELSATVEANRQAVLRLWREKGPRKAFHALIRASLPLPMTLRTASLMVRVARAAGTQEAAGTLLEAAIEDEASPILRERLHRQLARLWRGADQPERAMEAYKAALSEEAGPKRWRLLRALGFPYVAPGAARGPDPEGAPEAASSEWDAAPAPSDEVPFSDSAAAAAEAGRGDSDDQREQTSDAPQEPENAQSVGAAEDDAGATPVNAQRPADDDGREPTPVDAQRPADEDERDPTPVDAQRPATEDAREPTPVEASRPVVDEAREPTPVETQRPLEDEAREPTPVDAQRPVEAEGREPPAGEAGHPGLAGAADVTPVEAQRPLEADDVEPTPSHARPLLDSDLAALVGAPGKRGRGGKRTRSSGSRAALKMEPRAEDLPWAEGPEGDSKRLSTDLFQLLSRPPTRPQLKAEQVREVRPRTLRGPPIPTRGRDGRAATVLEVPAAYEEATPSEAKPLSPAESEAPRAQQEEAGSAWSEVTRPSAEHGAVRLDALQSAPTRRSSTPGGTTRRATPPPPSPRAVGARPNLAKGQRAHVADDAPALTDPGTILRKEASFVASGSWKELAAFYRRRAERAGTSEERAEYQSRLAELLETELEDAQAAAEVYGEMVAAGEDFALTEQLRLLEVAKDQEGARRALDNAVFRATTPQAELAALVTRGEWFLATGSWSEAQEDFQAALSVAPDHVRALLGWTEARLHTGTQASLTPIRERLEKIPERHPERVPALKRLALLADSLGEIEVGGWAWQTLYAEDPQDAEAAEHALTHARRKGEVSTVEAILRSILMKQPRGEQARRHREELWTLLTSLGREAEALTEIRLAGRSEPGHREAWIALSERMEARGSYGEAAWALEQAATATEDEQLREETWRQLARFAEERLRDPVKAERFIARADAMKELRLAAEAAMAAAQAEQQAAEEAARAAEAAAPEPAREGTDPDAEKTPPAITPAHSATAVSRAPGPIVRHDGPTQLAEHPLPPEVERELILEGFTGEQHAAPRGSRAEELLNHGFDRVHADPLDPDGFRLLAEAFSVSGDGARSLLMVELAHALEGEVTGPVDPPNLELTASDRLGLRHPLLREEAGELLAAVGHVFCSLFPTDASRFQNPPFTSESGRGAAAATEALMGSVRVLGLRAADVAISDAPGPPFGVVRPDAPLLMVGQMAVQRVLPAPELRFFAGRALMSQEPDLLVLRGLRRDQVTHALSVLGWALSDDAGSSDEEEIVRMRAALVPEIRSRLKELHPRVSAQLRFQILADGARDSANRAGLVTCGAVGPALAALRSKKALKREMEELIRFAASERYFQLRQRALGR
ncbi:MAG TPA: hypothetical protein VK013_16335 [Myxococcaceae bacterium]|nr:hypothetical protein [Myxococcaceae bacterium]